MFVFVFVCVFVFRTATCHIPPSLRHSSGCILTRLRRFIQGYHIMGGCEARRTLSVSQIEISREFHIFARVPLFVILVATVSLQIYLQRYLTSSPSNQPLVGMSVTSLRFQAATTFALAKRYWFVMGSVDSNSDRKSTQIIFKENLCRNHFQTSSLTIKARKCDICLQI